MPALSLETTPRTSLGRKNKALRRSGLTPLHLYGPGGDPLILQAPSPIVRKLLVTAGKTTAVNIVVEGTDGEELSFVRWRSFWMGGSLNYRRCVEPLRVGDDTSLICFEFMAQRPSTT